MLVVAIVGGVVGAFAMQYLDIGTRRQSVVYQAQTGGVDVALKQREATASSSQSIREYRILVGSVTNVGNNRITLDANLMNFSDDASLDSRTVLIGPATKIVMLTPRDTKVVQVEMADFTKKVQAGADPKTLTPPDPFMHALASTASITIGDMVNVIASEDIAAKKEFSADSIEIMPKIDTK